MIVNERVLRLLQARVGDQIDHGTVVIEGKPRVKDWFWIRPRGKIGRSLAREIESICPRCGSGIEKADRRRYAEPVMRIVERFGDQPLDIAMVRSEDACEWLGHLECLFTRDVVVSGGLLAYLHQENVKGLCLPGKGDYMFGYYLSAAGESPFTEEIRFRELLTDKTLKYFKSRYKPGVWPVQMVWDESETAVAQKAFEDDFAEDRSEYNEIVAHISKHIKEPDVVAGSLIPIDDSPDIHSIHPTKERPFRTMITVGMSARAMSVPDDVDEPAYAELLICLPQDWPFSKEKMKKEQNWWPLFWLRKLAEAPFEHDTWFAEGHTIPNGDPPGPLGEGVEFCCWLIRKPKTTPEAFQVLMRPDGDVHFWAIVPIYKDEMKYKLKHGYEALAKLLDAAGVTELIDIHRPSVVPKRKKK